MCTCVVIMYCMSCSRSRRLRVCMRACVSYSHIAIHTYAHTHTRTHTHAHLYSGVPTLGVRNIMWHSTFDEVSAFLTLSIQLSFPAQPHSVRACVSLH